MKQVSNSNTGGISIAENHHSSTFLQGFEGNPFARIRCRSFMRLCTGVCANCKKERDEFRFSRLIYWQQYLEMEKVRSGGDPNILQNPLTPEQMLEAEIVIIGVQKEARFANEYQPHLIQEAIQQRTSATLQ